MPECRHLVDRDTCADCTPRPAVPSARDYGPWITAQYEGNCAECGGEICPGDRIRASGTGGWLDEECGSYDGIDTLTGAPARTPPGKLDWFLAQVQEAGER